MNDIATSSSEPAADMNMVKTRPTQVVGTPRLCSGSERPEVDRCVMAEAVVTIDGYTVTVFGHVMPVAVAVTVVTNCLVCIVLLRKTMRTPSNILLVAMAISDTMTGLTSMPAFVHFYTFGAYVDYIPYNWCIVYNWLTDHIPTIFHTASVWLTVALAAQRYVYVCHSVKAKHLCTVSNMGKVIAAIYIGALLSQLTRFFDNHIEPIEVPSRSVPNTTFTGCHIDFVQLVADNLNIYYNVYFWFRVIFIHFAPCTALVCFTGSLSRAMQLARRRRQQLLKLNRRQECLRLQENNSTTLMLVVVVAMFLLVEFPTGVLMSIMIIENTGDVAVVDQETRAVFELITNLVIVLSYPLNFFIYCAMSRQFRQTFCGLFAGVFTRVRAGQTLVTNGNTADGGGEGGGAWETTSAYLTVGGARTRRGCGGGGDVTEVSVKRDSIQYAPLVDNAADHGVVMCAIYDDAIPLDDMALKSTSSTDRQTDPSACHRITSARRQIDASCSEEEISGH